MHTQGYCVIVWEYVSSIQRILHTVWSKLCILLAVVKTKDQGLSHDNVDQVNHTKYSMNRLHTVDLFHPDILAWVFNEGRGKRRNLRGNGLWRKQKTDVKFHGGGEFGWTEWGWGCRENSWQLPGRSGMNIYLWECNLPQAAHTYFPTPLICIIRYSNTVTSYGSVLLSIANRKLEPSPYR